MRAMAIPIQAARPVADQTGTAQATAGIKIHKTTKAIKVAQTEALKAFCNSSCSRRSASGERSRTSTLESGRGSVELTSSSFLSSSVRLGVNGLAEDGA